MTGPQEITLHSIDSLLSILYELKEWTLPRLRNRYLDEATSFDSNLRLITALGCVRIVGEQIQPGPMWKVIVSSGRPDLGQTRTRAIISELLLSREHELSAHLEEFLAQFSYEGEAWRVRMAITDRVRLSNVRNLLIDLGVVSYEEGTDQYQILECDWHWWISQSQRRSISAAEFKRIQKSHEELGRRAELEVVDFEKQRLSSRPDLIPHIRHVAELDVAAGYDILSYSIADSGLSEDKPRRIEVKAVPATDHRFFWSRNELDSARKFRCEYFLYLVPSGRDGLLLDDIVIIQDPIANVFDRPNEWMSTIEQFSFKRIKDSIKEDFRI